MLQTSFPRIGVEPLYRPLRIPDWPCFVLKFFILAILLHYHAQGIEHGCSIGPTSVRSRLPKRKMKIRLSTYFWMIAVIGLSIGGLLTIIRFKEKWIGQKQNLNFSNLSTVIRQPLHGD